MQNRRFKWPVLKTVVFGAAAALLLAFSAAEAASPFATLKGTWSGGGRISFGNGQTERIRCNAYYRTVDNENVLGLAIRCASASNKIEIRGRLTYRGGSVAGVWEERTFNASGTATGRASDGRVSLRLAGAIPGAMDVTVSRSRQSVAINTQGTAIQAVQIALRRR